MAYLEPQKASVIFQKLSKEVQEKVSKKIACMDKIHPAVLREIERVFEKKIASSSRCDDDYTYAGGAEVLEEILSFTGNKGE